MQNKKKRKQLGGWQMSFNLIMLDEKLADHYSYYKLSWGCVWHIVSWTWLCLCLDCSWMLRILASSVMMTWLQTTSVCWSADTASIKRWAILLLMKWTREGDVDYFDFPYLILHFTVVIVALELAGLVSNNKQLVNKKCRTRKSL